METIIMQIQSFCIVLLILVGIKFKSQRKTHISLMSTAIIWDIVLILQIELSRSAVLKASKVITNTLMLNVHVAIALTTVIFYVLMILSGRKVLKGEMSFRPKHKRLGYLTLGLRILTFITSFWAVTPKE